MAEKVKFTIEVDDNGAVKVVEKLGKAFEKTTEKAEQTEKAVDDTKEAVDKSEGGFKKFAATIKGGLGIGLVVSALDSLRDGLMQNQKVKT